MIKTVNTKKAPLPVGPYSQAVTVGNLIFCSGQIGIDPKTGELKEGIENQTKQIMKNLKELLEASKSDFDHVLKTTIYLVNKEDFFKVNEIYGQYFPKTKPARSTVIVSSLPKNALIEIEMIAIVKK